MTDTAKVWHRECSGHDWKAFIDVMNSGKAFECDEEMWFYWLEVLPPKRGPYLATLPGGEQVHASFGFAEGAEMITAFWERDGRFFGCQTGEMSNGL